MMDLGGLDLRSVPGAEMELLHPGTGEATGVFLTVSSYDSEAVEAAARAVAQHGMKGRKTDAPDFMRRRRVAMAQAAVTDVRGGTGSTKTAEAVRDLMAQPGFVWIVEQVEAFAGDRASFFKSAETP